MCKFLFSLVLTFCASASFGIGASQEWVKNYVTTLTTSASDDELRVTENGQAYFSAVQVIAGNNVQTTHYLTPSSATIKKGTYQAARVVDSSDKLFKMGEVLAFVYGDVNECYLVNGDRTLTVREEKGILKVYSPVAYGEGTNNIAVVSKDLAGNEIGFFVLEPMLLRKESWEKIALSTGGEYDGVDNIISWAKNAACAEGTIDITLSKAQQMKFRMRASNGGLEEQPTIISIKLKAVPDGEYYPTIEYAAANGYVVDYYGEKVTPTHDNCWAEPSSVINPNDWFDIGNWVELPQVVMTYYQAEDGLWYETEKKIRSIEALKNLLKGYPDVKIPPRNWPGFKLVAKEDCRKSGDHIYGKNCECINCGHQREHVFEKEDENLCARCVNLHDAYIVDIRGQKKKKGLLNIKCALTPKQAGGEVFDLSLHGGWHHEDVEGDETHNCSCECGFYSAKAEKLLHEFNHEEGDKITEWSKRDHNGQMDGIHHFAFFECVRCHDKVKEVKERHEIKLETQHREPGSCEYVDVEFHNAIGYCKICEFGKIDDEKAYILEPHDRNDECYCDLCETVVHNYHTLACGRFTNSYCINCGKKDIQEQSNEHDYGVPMIETVPEYRTHHQCYCGNGEPERHIFENGKCKVCGVREVGGVKCASKKTSKGEIPTANAHDQNREMEGGFYCSETNLTSGTSGVTGCCTDCGGGFFLDYPEAVKHAKSPSRVSVFAFGSGYPVSFTGEAATLIDGLHLSTEYVNLVLHLGKFVGRTIDITIEWNPESVEKQEVKDFAFYPNAVAIQGKGYSGKAEYKGVIVKESSWGNVINWK